MNAGPAWLVDVTTWLETTALGEGIRMTPHVYPVLMGLHVVGIALLMGPIVAVDLRLLGVGRKGLPVTGLMRHLLPVVYTGLAIVAVTGLLMFTAVAVTVGASAAAPRKLGLVVLAGVNALLFHRGVYRTVETWDVGPAPPLRAKLAAMVSMLAWTGTVFAGRFLAY